MSLQKKGTSNSNKSSKSFSKDRSCLKKTDFFYTAMSFNLVSTGIEAEKTLNKTNLIRTSSSKKEPKSFIHCQVIVPIPPLLVSRSNISPYQWPLYSTPVVHLKALRML
jgi:hypothetical protein